MTTSSHATVVGVFRDRAMAEQAMEALRSAGFSPDQIRHSGSAGGSSGGFFEDMKNLFTGADASRNDSSNDLTNDLTGMGISNEEVRYYSNEYNNGNTIIAIKAHDRAQEAMSLLSRYGAYSYSPTPVSTATTNSAQQASPDYAQRSSNYAQTDNRNIADEDTVQQQRPAPASTAQASMAQESQGADPTNPNTSSQMTQERTTREFPKTGNPITASRAQATTQATTQPQAQQVTSTDNYDTRYQSAQEQLRTLQQQLQDAHAQLQAAKDREAQLRVTRERETQFNELQKQIEEAKAQLQATQAELRDTQSRMNP